MSTFLRALFAYVILCGWGQIFKALHLVAFFSFLHMSNLVNHKTASFLLLNNSKEETFSLLLVTSDKEVMFSPGFVCRFVSLFVEIFRICLKRLKKEMI